MAVLYALGRLLMRVAIGAAVALAGCAVPEIGPPSEQLGRGGKADDGDGGTGDGGTDGAPSDATTTDAGTDGPLTDAGDAGDGAVAVDAGRDAPPDAPDPPVTGPPADPVTLYLAMDGEDLTCGTIMDARVNALSDAMCRYQGAHGALNGTGLCGFWVPFQNCKSSIADKVSSQFGSWRVNVTTTRPTSGNYLMVVVDGGKNTVDLNAENPNVRSPISCSGNVLQNSIGIVFADGLYWEETWGLTCSWRTIDSLVESIAHVAGHMMGLFHNEETGSIMYPVGRVCGRSWACGLLRDTGSDGGLARCRTTPPADVACPGEHLNRVVGPRVM